MKQVVPRSKIAVVSQVVGLRAAMEARGLTGMHWVDTQATAADEQLASCEVLVGEPVLCAALVAEMPKLAWLQSTFAGCKPLLDAAKRDYVVTRCAGFFGPDMAEYAAGMLIGLERDLKQHQVRQQRAEWIGAREGGGSYRRLPTLTLGVLGLGDIGTCIASTFSRGFGMQVLGYRRTPTMSDRDREAGVRAVFGIDELETFLSRCDYIVAVVPSTPATRGLLDGDVLKACTPRQPTLINVGRGDLLSESTIVRALDQGWLRHYVGDVVSAVTPTDPPSTNQPVRARSPSHIACTPCYVHALPVCA